ncbi:MAG: AAA family ATPase, partial [Lachnospiraceae bacterium]
MPKTVGIGIQSFIELMEGDYFYIDKTDFIKEWWESGDSVTLITRPRRFGKTMNMSMLEQFFSVEYSERGDLFEGLSIWKEEKYRQLQGTYPVISLSFANVKETDYETTNYRIRQLLMKQYEKKSFLLDSDVLSEAEKSYFKTMAANMSVADAPMALYQLSDYLCRYYGKKVIILLDEYDTPMQEAYVDGYWDDLVSFTRSLFNSTFKTNPYMARGVMTGITRVSKESIFSDLNNLEVVTTTSEKYEEAFGFTQEEVFASLDEYGYGEKKEEVKYWYDGFVFGNKSDIYNPWSILNFLEKGKIAEYWANTSSNSLVGKLIREGDEEIKTDFERLLRGESVHCPIDEQIVYNQLDENTDAIWSLLLAGGYLKVLSVDTRPMMEWAGEPVYELALTNYEVRIMFTSMVRTWFRGAGKKEYNAFITSMLEGDLDGMNEYMNEVALETFSFFDTQKRPSKTEPERFYHGFVLGLMVELADRYVIESNRESGLGRYDVMLKPKKKDTGDAIIMEFKVRKSYREKTLEETVQAALTQIKEKKYKEILLKEGYAKEHIRTYGFAFEGKTVLIG